MKKRIILIGSVEFSKTLFSEVAKDKRISVCGIVTKKKSLINADYYDLSPFAKTLRVPSFYADENEEKSLFEFVRQTKPDIGYCFGWSHLLKPELLSIPPMGWVGYHPSLLPLNRGRHPIIWALALGLRETGSTFFSIDEGADTGKILSQKIVTISNDDDATSLYRKLELVAKKQITHINSMVCKGILCGISQNIEEGNYWRKRNKEDGHIDFRMPSDGIRNLTRALKPPYPGAYIEYANREYIVDKVDIISKKTAELNHYEPGKVIAVKANRLYVRSGDGLVTIYGDFPFEAIKRGDYLK